MRVVIDTNVLVSGIAYPQSVPGRIVGAWRSGSLGLVTSHYLLDEFKRVLPRLSCNTLTADEIEQLADSLLLLGEVVDPEKIDDMVRDAKDNPVLAVLVESKAECLITGDKDLLVLSDRFTIVSPAQFWEKYGS
ncbi:MAG: putative toxin-antitoxin system toxin component, PIN family [Coriobacteriales bacterium]|nr:putative toxin-antitoxin system toxin component, PIN family [Coriobacteriales bacterium]